MANNNIVWDSVEKEAVDILKNYLQINTTNPPGNEIIGAEFLKGILEEAQVLCDIYESLPGRGSLISRYFGENKLPDILLLHHIDVVPAEDKKWSHPPFSGIVVNGEIWGRGAIDCKSLGVMELMAFIILKRQGLFPEKHFVYAATADEETGGRWGVPWLLDQHPDKLNARFVINEGMGLGFSTEKSTLYFCQVAEKGSNWIRITFEGSPGHASQPLDDNCVVDMAKAINALSSYKFPICITEPVKKFIYGIATEQEFMPKKEFLGLLEEARSSEVLERIPVKALRQMLFASLRNTLVPTVARAGSKTNVIPSESYCEVDCRILPGSTPDELLQIINDILTTQRCRNFTIEFRGKSLSSESPADTPLYNALTMGFKKNDHKAKVVPYMSSGATDSRFFRQKGIPAYGIQIDTTMDSIERIHGHNERISIKQLTKGIKILYDTLREFCS